MREQKIPSDRRVNNQHNLGVSSVTFSHKWLTWKQWVRCDVPSKSKMNSETISCVNLPLNLLQKLQLPVDKGGLERRRMSPSHAHIQTYVSPLSLAKTSVWQQASSWRLPGFSALVWGFSRVISAAPSCARWQRWCLQQTGELWDWNLHKQSWWNHRGSKVYHFRKISDIFKVGNERCFCCFFTSTWSFLWEISSMSVFPFLLFLPRTMHST